MVDHVALDLYVRTTFQDARVARSQIKKGKAKGRKLAVRFRAWGQDLLDRLGRSIHRKTHLYILPLLVGLGVLLGGFKAFEQTSDFNKLWVEEGGRLESELQYSQQVLGESETVVHLLFTQTAKINTNIIPPPQIFHKKALLTHLKILKVASHVTVNIFDVTWSLKDICVSPSPPDFEVSYIDTIFENMMPCGIITPLDCFWEGSKLLGPENPIFVPGIGLGLKWTNMHPFSLMKYMRTNSNMANFPFDRLESYMKRAGIYSGYQEKLCLDPEDPDCPQSSPNKKLDKFIDLGIELANGCRGYASKYMNWPKELILGNITLNRTGYIQNANALQSVIQLMGERELHEYWSQTYKVVHLTWDKEKASMVLKMWQKKFNEEIKKMLKNDPIVASSYNFHTFSTMLLNDLLDKYDFFDIKLIYYGCLIMVIFVSFMQINVFDAVRSQLVLGIFGFLLILLSLASGIGFCSIIGIQFHSATIAVVIIISLAIGVNNMFLLMFNCKRISSHGYDRTTQEYSGHMGKKQVGMVLKSSGTNILMTSIIIIAVFLTSAVVPIPALRAFCLQVAILVLFVVVTVLFGVTSLISFDLRRKRSARIDIFCCIPSKYKNWPFLKKNKKNNNNNDYDYENDYNDNFGTASTIDDQMRQYSRKSDSPIPSANLLLKELNDLSSDSEDIPVVTTNVLHFWNWKFGQNYIHCLTLGSCQIYIILIFVVTMSVSIWGITKIEAGLTLPEMVPDGTNEQKFLETYSQMFGFYNMHAVTKGDFEYPTNQKLLYEYHDAFMRVPNILKNDNGGLPQMWLKLFREWLLGLQKAFDKDWARKCINQEGWLACASENGILGYKLLVQTGNSDNPIDKSLVFNARLVDDSGIINEETFYNLLTAWVSNDILAYGASQANIRPEPRRWIHVSNDFDLQISKSSPIIYAQMPFYVNNLYNTSVITKFISIVRSICTQFDERGLPNYPSGLPFVYWEQYQDLFQYLYGTIGISLLFVFVFGALFLFNFKAAFITLLMSIILIIQMLGFMGFTGIKFSAISVVLLIGTIGIGSIFSVHLTLSFITCIGDKQKRTQLSLNHMSRLVLQSAVTLVITVIMLIFQKNYVSKLYFYILIANTGFGLLNGLVYLPVFLSIFGPSSELQPLKYADRISTPSPEPIKKRSRYTSIRQSIPPPSSNRKTNRQKKDYPKRLHKKHQENSSRKKRRHRVHYIPRDGSLSTITEESGSGSFLSQMEKIKSPKSLSRSLSSSMSLSLSDCSTSTDSEFEAEMDTPQRTQSVPSVSSWTPSPTRCVVTAKFELELDNNVVQPCVHTSSSKILHNNCQPRRHKRQHSNRY